MGLIKEPLDIDFYVDPRPLTIEEKSLISEYIKADKLRRHLQKPTIKRHIRTTAAHTQCGF